MPGTRSRAGVARGPDVSRFCLSKVDLPVSITPGPNDIHLRLLATTDVHVQIHPYDYYADRPAPESGLALLATLISQLRAQTPNTLLLDNGDILQGSPMGVSWPRCRTRQAGPCTRLSPQ